jgi:hypothetical protein
MPIFSQWVSTYMSHACVGKNSGGPPIKSSKFWLFIADISSWVRGGVDARCEGGVPADLASVVARVFGWAMSDPTRGRGEHTINSLPLGCNRHQNRPITSRSSIKYVTLAEKMWWGGCTTLVIARSHISLKSWPGHGSPDTPQHARQLSTCPRFSVA